MARLARLVSLVIFVLVVTGHITVGFGGEVLALQIPPVLRARTPRRIVYVMRAMAAVVQLVRAYIVQQERIRPVLGIHLVQPARQIRIAQVAHISQRVHHLMRLTHILILEPVRQITAMHLKRKLVHNWRAVNRLTVCHTLAALVVQGPVHIEIIIMQPIQRAPQQIALNRWLLLRVKQITMGRHRARRVNRHIRIQTRGQRQMRIVMHPKRIRGHNWRAVNRLTVCHTLAALARQEHAVGVITKVQPIQHAPQQIALNR